MTQTPTTCEVCAKEEEPKSTDAEKAAAEAVAGWLEADMPGVFTTAHGEAQASVFNPTSRDEQPMVISEYGDASEPSIEVEINEFTATIVRAATHLD